jgi:signal transduction histidine kinase
VSETLFAHFSLFADGRSKQNDLPVPPEDERTTVSGVTRLTAIKKNSLQPPTTWAGSTPGLARSDKALSSFNAAALEFNAMGNRYWESPGQKRKWACSWPLKNNTPAPSSTSINRWPLLQPGDKRLLGLVSYMKGRSLSAQEKHSEAAAAFVTARQVYEELGMPFLMQQSRLRLGEEYILDGKDAEAVKVLNAVLRQPGKPRDKSLAATACCYLGIVSTLNNDFEAALEFYKKSLAAERSFPVLKLVRDTYLKLLSSSEVRNDAERRRYYNKLYYQYRDSIQGLGDPSADGRGSMRAKETQRMTNAMLMRKGGRAAIADKAQLEFNKKLNEAELQRLKAEDALALLNKEKVTNEAEVHDRETRIAQLQKEMAEQDLALSREELQAARQRQLIILLLVSSVAVVTITLVLFSRYRQKKRSHEEVDNAFRELSATHEQLKVMQDQLIHSEKMASLGQLTAGIAHEIQNPLNFVNNFSEVSTELLNELEMSVHNEEQKATIGNLRRNLQKITQHGKRADSIIKGMLLHSRNGSHEKQLSDLNQMADEFLHLAYHGMRTKTPGFTCEIEAFLAPDLPRASVVPQDFSRVLLNLFSNAFYAVSEKKKTSSDPSYMPRVTVATRSEGNKIYVSVTDNGNGIPPEVTEKIFNPFFTTKPPGEGTGLGLSISYDIVTIGHQGEFSVETREGEFTRFTVTLPANT